LITKSSNQFFRDNAAAYSPTVKVLVIGENNSIRGHILKSLEKASFKVKVTDFVNYREILLKDPLVKIVFIVLPDYSRYTLKRVEKIREFLSFRALPIIAVIQPGLELEYEKILDIDFDEFIFPPFDSSEIEFRSRMLLKRKGGFPQIVDGEALASSSIFYTYSQYLMAVLQLFEKPLVSFNFDQLVNQVLEYLQILLQAHSIYFFELENAETLTLHNSIPSNLIDKWKIPVQNYPLLVKATRLKKPTLLNSLQEDNDLLLYLRSFLNIKINSLAIFPVKYEETVKGLLFILKDNEGKFLEADYALIQLFMEILQLGYGLIEAKKSLTSLMDAQIFKYSYDYLDSIINQLNYGILVLSKDLTIKYLNDVTAELLRISKKDAIYKKLNKYLSGENIREILEYSENQGHAFKRPELKLQSPDGQQLIIGFSSQPFQLPDEDDEGFIISLKDITYSKEFEEEMQRMDRLASLGVMASGIAHEIRNPLAGIKAIAQTFQEEIPEDDPKNEFVKRILRQVDRLDEMLKSLFSYARPRKANRQFCSMEEIIQEVVALLNPKIQEKQIRFVQSIEPQVPDAFVDPGQIQQVLMNLILNSIEAIDKQGEILLEIKSVPNTYPRLSRKPFYRKITGNNYLEIHIRDNGCGISRENLQQIFNPFFTTKTFGTGLGLSIVYQMVKENDGVIYVESEVNKGTDFYLFLPTQEKREKLTVRNEKNNQIWNQ